MLVPFYLTDVFVFFHFILFSGLFVDLQEHEKF